LIIGGECEVGKRGVHDRDRHIAQNKDRSELTYYVEMSLMVGWSDQSGSPSEEAVQDVIREWVERS
jgi:hypothetical protein